MGDEVSVQAACLNSYHTKTCDCKVTVQPLGGRGNQLNSDETSTHCCHKRPSLFSVLQFVLTTIHRSRRVAKDREGLVCFIN